MKAGGGRPHNIYESYGSSEGSGTRISHVAQKDRAFLFESRIISHIGNLGYTNRLRLHGSKSQVGVTDSKQ